MQSVVRGSRILLRWGWWRVWQSLVGLIGLVDLIFNFMNDFNVRHWQLLPDWGLDTLPVSFVVRGGNVD